MEEIRRWIEESPYSRFLGVQLEHVDEKSARLVLRTSTHEAIAFSAPTVRLFSADEIGPDTRWGSLGPDPLRRIPRDERLILQVGDASQVDIL